MSFILTRFPIKKAYPLFEKYIQQYITMAQCLVTLSRMEKEGKSGEKEDRSMIHIYAVDAKLWLEEAKRALCIGFACVRMNISEEQEGQRVMSVRTGELIKLCLALL